MLDKKDNPLYNIFIKTSKGDLSNEIDNIKNIQFFFNYLKNEKNKDEFKAKIIEELAAKIHINRYIAEFFSSHDNKSIYVYLFDLYSHPKTSQSLKDKILFLLNELRYNIQTGKDVYEYLFQKLSQVYRGEITPTANNLYTYLKLLNIVLADTEACQPPKNFFACSGGHCKFSVDLNKKPIEVGSSFSIILNFKISNYIAEDNPDKNRISNLVKIYFSNKKTLSVDLMYPFFLIVKEIRKEFIKTFPNDEWINLIITIANVSNSFQFFFYVNGENHPYPFKIEKLSLKCDDTIKYIDFFNNFYGEVTSIYMFSQNDQGPPGMNNSNFLSQFKSFKEGLWKKAKIDALFQILPTYESINQDLLKSKTVYIKSPQTKLGEKKNTLWEDLVFVFTPINYCQTRPNIVEDAFSHYTMQFSGNIKNHIYQSYQKKLALVSGFSNFYPIAEMFLIYPETLTEQNFELFLKTIGNILNFRKQNLKSVKPSKLFKILSMFMEKYPNQIFTEKILNALDSLGKSLFINNTESICSNYFNYILLNEKILSKYNENLQIKFWNRLFLFCQSDITQIEIFLNINRLCLILRFYDKNKYKEICCEEHLNMIKEEYAGSRKVMNPNMNKKLSKLKNIMDLIIDSQEPSKALALFKLLTLDLSPCLIKFILNIFINAFDKSLVNETWKEKFVEQLIQAKYEVIIVNTFLHSLPDVRVELLKFVYHVHLRLVTTKKANNFKIFERMIKTCLLPNQMFYSKRMIKQEIIIESTEEEESKKIETKKVEPKKEEPKKVEPIKAEPKKEEPPKKEETPKKVEPKKEEPPKKEETPKKEEPKKVEPKKEEPKKVEPRKEEPPKKEENKAEKKVEETKLEKPKKEIQKSQTMAIKDQIEKKEEKKEVKKEVKKEEKKEEKKPELKATKTFQINDNKKEEISKPLKVGTDKKSFMALLSKFENPKNNKEETKKVIPKKIQRDNPFFKSLNATSSNTSNKPNDASKKPAPQIKKKEEIPKKEEKEKPKEEKLKEEIKKPISNEEKSKETKDNKPKEEKPKEEKPKDVKPKEEKPKEEKPQVEKPKEEKPMEEKPKVEKPKEEKPKEEKPKEDKSKMEKQVKIEENKEKKEELKSKLEHDPKNVQTLEKKNETNKVKSEKEKSGSENLKNINKNEKANNSKDNKKKTYKYVESGEEEIIIKDSEIKKYYDKLYSIFILWSLAIDVSFPFDAISLDHSSIKNVNAIEILFLLNNKLKDKKLIINFLKSIDRLANNSENCYQLFFNIKVLSSFLDITFDNYRLKGKDEETCFNLGKNILIKLFINSFIFCEKQQNTFPGKDIDIIFIWGNKIREKDISKEESLFEFLFELLFEFLTKFKLKYEPKISSNNSNFNASKNYYLKNYLYFNTVLYTFIFKFKLDIKIHKEGVQNLGFGNRLFYPSTLIDTMRMNPKNDIINKSWIDYPFIYDVINRVRHFWAKKNVYKNHKFDKCKSKPEKYQKIIENILLDKDKKNVYQKELEFLCFDDIKGDYEYIIPLIRIIPVTFMCILFKLNSMAEEKDFKYWLKEFKCFIRFLIIASSNLTKINQLDLYNSIQDKCMDAITASLSFLYFILLKNTICKEKVENNIKVLLLFCFKILKYQCDYKIKHNKILKKISTKPARNNLQDCAVCRLFNEFVKDKSDNLLLSLNQLETMNLDTDKSFASISNLMNSQDFIELFLENQNLKLKISNSFYVLKRYKILVDYRFDLIQFLQDSLDESYKNTILVLLPQYESELAKYSNNSLEKNIKNKTRYKVFKKNAFSWRGFWSCRGNFFDNASLFKYKLINHYTKNFMKPILVPIIDISYYLPEFSGFDIKNLFKNEKNGNNQNKFKLNLDIDKVLKSSEHNVQETSATPGKEKEAEEENYLLSIYKKSNPILYEKLLKIANNLEFGKEEEFSLVERESSDEKKKNDEKKVKKYFLSCLVKTSHHIKGVCFIDEKKLNFKVFLNQRTGSAMSGVEVGFTSNDDDYDQTRKTCFGSYFVCHPKDKDLYKISINYDDIKWIFKRKYYYTNSALEVFTTTNKTFYFNFKYENDRESVLSEILKKLDSPIPIIDDLKEKEVIVGYENGSLQKKKGEKNKNLKLSKKIKMWKSWEISNFEILMWLNIFGNRSYNDISQYPVFPWILSNYEDPLQVEQTKKKEREIRTQSYAEVMESLNMTNTGISVSTLNLNEDEDEVVFDYLYRDMSLPMGMLELSDQSIKRKEEFIMIYETLLEEPDENNKPYVFGSNYSNPIYVCNYLMRLFPFTHISIELQGQGFDKPDRLFLSVKNSFFNSTTQKGDVRELIPEFFYLPEMFKNINNLNMGKLENGQEVNDVETPCHNNPYDFIMTMRSVLENNSVSSTIQNWIDLIFGYKAKGKDAEIAKNIFKEGAYQESVDINKIEDKEAKLREVEFGLIPNQLMIKECYKRDRKYLIKRGKEITDSSCDLQWYKCKGHNDADTKGSEGLPVIKFECFSNEKITMLIGGNYIYEKKITYSKMEKVFNEELMPAHYRFNYYHKMSDFYNPKKPNSKAIQFCHKGKTLVLGGFFDGKVLIIPLDQKASPTQLISFSDKSPILSISISQDDEFAFLGNNMGNIRIMRLDKEPNQWKFDRIITDHLSAISHIDCSSELNLWVSASIDGYINLYTLPLSKLLRSIKVPTSYCDYVFLSSSPLPSIICISEENKLSEIFVYSINGNLLLRQKEESTITNPIIIKDLNSNEYLAYIMNESITIRSLPNLFRQASIDDIPEIFAICPSEDMKMMYATNKNGTQVYVIRDELK